MEKAEAMKDVTSDEDLEALLQEQIAPMKAWQQMKTLQQTSEEEGLADVVEKAEAMKDLTSDEEPAARRQEQIAAMKALEQQLLKTAKQSCLQLPEAGTACITNVP